MILTISPVLRFPGHEAFIAFLLFVCVCALAWVRITNPKRILNLVTGFLKVGTAEEKTISPDSVALFIVFLCSVSVIGIRLSALSGVAGKIHESSLLITYSCLALAAWYMLKTIAILLCGFIFGMPGNARDYINEIYVFTSLAGIILLPLAILSTYSDVVNPDALGRYVLVGLTLLICYRTIKMFILMANRGLNVVYLILYLCTLEICPLVLIYEFIKLKIEN